MTTATVMSMLALIVSVISVSFSIFFGTRDRGRLQTSSYLYSGDDEHPPCIKIAAVNRGRRPLILRMWGGTDDKGEWAGTFIDHDQHGHRLGEQERFEISLENSDLGFDFDQLVEFTELWFEDSVGRRHRIKSSRKHIKEFWASWRSFSSAQDRGREVSILVAREVREAMSREGSKEESKGTE